MRIPASALTLRKLSLMAWISARCKPLPKLASCHRAPLSRRWAVGRSRRIIASLALRIRVRAVPGRPGSLSAYLSTALACSKLPAGLGSLIALVPRCVHLP